MKRIMLVAALLIGMAPASFAHCDKGIVERLNFALDNSPTNFAAIRGVGDDESHGNQYELNKTGEAFCPKTFIITHYQPTDKTPEGWVMKFTWLRDSETTQEAATLAFLKEFIPSLASRGYHQPTISDGEMKYSYLLTFEGKDGSGEWMTVESWVSQFPDKDEPPNRVWFTIRVGHDIKK